MHYRLGTDVTRARRAARSRRKQRAAGGSEMTS